MKICKSTIDFAIRHRIQYACQQNFRDLGRVSLKKSTKTTIYDIAQRVKASPSTVSSALDGSWKARRISEKTVERIRTTALEMGYTTNLQARGLRKARSGLVGMILPEHNNRFFSELSQTFATQVRQRGFCPAIVSTRRDEHEELEVVSNLISYAVDALFIVGASNPDALSQLCSDAKLPHVFVDQPCRLAPSVVTDNYFGAKLLSEVLLTTMAASVDDNSAELYFLGGDATLPASMQRIKGFKDAIAQARGSSDESLVLACGYEKQLAGEELSKLYDRLGSLPAGLLVNSIDCFEGVLKFLSRLPEAEVSRCTIGCFDYDPFGVLLRFPVHMIRQRTNALVKKAYACIESGSKEPSLELVKPELIRP